MLRGISVVAAAVPSGGAFSSGTPTRTAAGDSGGYHGGKRQKAEASFGSLPKEIKEPRSMLWGVGNDFVFVAAAVRR